jgi:Coenzyme PQQ synthesis protein D (PqqD)
MVLEIPDDIMEKQLEGTTVLLSVRTGFYYTLNATGGRMWQLLRGGRSLEEIVETVAREHGEVPGRVEADLSTLVQDLESEGLVRRR